jgi:hypothetical protein
MLLHRHMREGSSSTQQHRLTADDRWRLVRHQWDVGLRRCGATCSEGSLQSVTAQSLAPEQVVRHAARAGHDIEVEAVEQLFG